MKLKNLCALITGANQGFGFEIAKQYVLEGAKVMLCARNLELLQKAQTELQSIAPSATICIQQTNIADAKEVEDLVKASMAQLGKIDILVANAGVYGTKGPIDKIDWQEWSDAIDINLKGTVYLCKTVLPHLKNNLSGKIIIVSGGGATKPLPYLSAYAASKAGIVRFGETLAEELKDFQIDVNMIAPGALNTRLLDEIIQAGPNKVGEKFYQQSLLQKQQGGSPLSKGANLCVFLGSEASNGITAKLISAIWDPWIDLPSYLDELKNSDIYTLRRINPADRGKTWGEI